MPFYTHIYFTYLAWRMWFQRSTLSCDIFKI